MQPSIFQVTHSEKLYIWVNTVYRFDHYLQEQEYQSSQYFTREYEVGRVLYLLLLLKWVLSQKG